MIPSEWARDRARSRRGRPRVRLDQTTRPSAALSSRSRTRPNSRSWASGLRAVEPPRDVGQRRAGLDERRRDGERPRRRVRVGEGRGVHHDAGHQRGGQRAVAGVERHPEADREQRRPSRTSRRRAGSIQSAVAVGVVRGVVVDDRPAAAARTGRAWRAPTSPDPLERPAVGDDEQVVGRGRVRVGPEPLDAGQEVVERRRRVGADGVARPPSVSTRRATASVAPSVSASGFSWLTASTRRACAGARRPPPGRRRPRTEIEATAADRRVIGRCPGRVPGLDRACAAGARRGARRRRRERCRVRRRGGPNPSAAVAAPAAPGGHRASDSSWAQRARLGVGSDSPGVASSGVAPGLELVEELEDARPALDRVVELDVQVRDPLDPQPRAELVADERHRVLERGERRRRVRPAGR